MQPFAATCTLLYYSLLKYIYLKRKTFLQGIGITGISAILPGSIVPAGKKLASTPPDCILIPSETAGPFPLDLTENAFYFRQDVREDRAGVRLNLKMRITGLENCLPMPNLRVNIWHCDKDGLYSGYQTETGQTYLRGYQLTDADGFVEFTTIFPGWYNGRICHIHFQVYVSSVYAAVSQLSFPIDTKNQLYADYADLYTKGADPLTFATDNIFSDGYASQLATLTPNPDGNGFDSYLEVAIQGSGTTGLAKLEPETGGQFKLSQNTPNPYRTVTTVPFQLFHSGEVTLDIWDMAGKKVASLPLGRLSAGKHEIAVNLPALGLPAENYAYQLQVVNEYGTFRQSKLMTTER